MGAPYTRALKECGCEYYRELNYIFSFYILAQRDEKSYILFYTLHFFLVIVSKA